MTSTVVVEAKGGSSSAEHGSSYWLKGLKAGRPEAFDWLYARYYTRMVAYARGKLDRRGVGRGAAGVSDVVQDGALSFLKWAARREPGQPFPADGEELWLVLTTFVVRKVGRLVRQRRTVAMADLPTVADGFDDLLDQIETPEIDPEEAAMINEARDQLLDAFEENSWARRVVELAFEGRSTPEIVEDLEREFGISRATAYRKIDAVMAKATQFGLQ